jgi:uncharacterized membrane protein
MRNFSISIEVDAPADRVWAVMSDPERWHEWTPSVTSIRLLNGRPLIVGSRALIRQPKFPPALWTVTAIEPGSFTWVSTAPGVRVVARHWVEPLGESRTRASLSLTMEGLLGGLLGRMTKAITERYLAMEAGGLKARSENPEFRHAGARP